MKHHLKVAAVAATLASCHATQDVRIDNDRQSRSFRFVYEAAVEEVPAEAQRVRLWIPLPQDTADQQVSNVELTITPAQGEPQRTQVDDSEDLEKGRVGETLTWVANDFVEGQGRSLCVETKGKPVSLQVAYDVTRYETMGGGSADEDELEQLTEPNTMIPLDGKVARIASELKTGSDTLSTARVLYAHVLDQMRYDKPEGGAWGRGDAEWACDARFGNCTDFHSYFMGLARAKSIPARFEMGFSVPGGEEREATVGGYHCWAFFWGGERGWVPVDISEADKHPEKADYFFGKLDADRFTLTGGRDLVLDPEPEAGTLNFFVYPYAEVDGKAWSKTKKSFRRIHL